MCALLSVVLALGNDILCFGLLNGKILSTLFDEGFGKGILFL